MSRADQVSAVATSTQLAFYAVIASAIMAGSSGVFVKHLHIPATSISFIRTALPTFILGLVMLAAQIPFFRGNYRIMLVASVLNAIRMFCFFTAYLFTSIGNAVIILFTWPIFVSIFSVIFLNERISHRRLILLVLAFAGIVIVYTDKPFSFESQDFMGMTAALGAALAHALAVIIFKTESQNYSRIEIIFYQNLMSSFIFLPFIIFNEPLPTQNDLLIASSHAILLGIISFNFFFYGLQRLKASTASMLTYLEIISALLFGTFWMNEVITWNMVVGGLIIILTTALLRR